MKLRRWLTFGLIAALLGYGGLVLAQGGANTLTVNSAASGVAPSIRADGLDANINVNIVPKGTGVLQVNGTAVITGGGGTVSSLTINPGPLAVTGTTNLTGSLFMTPGTSVTLEGVGGVVLANSSTNVTTTLVATEEDLFNFSVLANTLSADNQFLDLVIRVRNAATANAKQTRVYFGATLIGNSTSVVNNNDWHVARCLIWRTGAATQKAICTSNNVANGAAWNTAAGGGANLSTPAENLAGAVTVRITGTDAVAAGGTNLEGVNLLWYPAGQ